jgi:hypothetical protein
MVLLSATECSCITNLWVSLVSFAAITLCVASQRVIPKVSVYFVMTQSGNFCIHPRARVCVCACMYVCMYVENSHWDSAFVVAVLFCLPETENNFSARLFGNSRPLGQCSSIFLHKRNYALLNVPLKQTTKYSAFRMFTAMYSSRKP